MTSPAERAAARRFALQMEDYERRLTALERRTSLARSSVHDGAINVYKGASDLNMVMGQQYDGSVVAASVGGPTPPRPSPPVVAPFSEGVKVSWDGQYGDPTSGETVASIVAPMDWARCDVVVAPSPESDFIGTPPVNAITSPRGGSVFVALDPGAYWVALVTRTASGKPSQVSLLAEVVVTEPPTGDDADPVGGSMIDYVRLTEPTVPIPANPDFGSIAGYVPDFRTLVVGEGGSAVITLYIPSVILANTADLFVYVNLNDVMIQTGISQNTPTYAPGNTLNLTVVTQVLEVGEEYRFDVGFRTAAAIEGQMLSAESYPTTMLIQRL